MIIGVDKTQKAGQHELKHQMLKERGHELMSLPLPVGDYIKVTDAIQTTIDRRGDRLKKMDLLGLIEKSVDTKRDCAELYSCLIQSHKRFSDECYLAYINGMKLYILTENRDGITTSDEIGRWKNENRWRSYFALKKKAERTGQKLPKAPATPTQLRKIMWTMHEKYEVEFLFCSPEETAEKIEELLQ